MRTPATAKLKHRLNQLKAVNVPFGRGIDDWLTGEDFPERPADDDGTSSTTKRWVRFVLARGLDWMARRDIAEQVGCDSAKLQFDPPHHHPTRR